MAISTEIQRIKGYISKWNQVRNTDLGLNFLTSGFGLSIYRDEYEKWLAIEVNSGKEIENIHLYLGVVEFEIMFFMVDSLTEAEGKVDNDVYKVGENLFIKEYTENIDSEGDIPTEIPDLNFIPLSNKKNEINKKEAMRRSLKWLLYSQTWFQSQRTNIAISAACEEPLPGVILGTKIPFKDLKLLFQSNVNKIFAFNGIRNDKVGDVKMDILDLILTTYTEPDSSGNVLVQQFADLTMPCPPFSIADFSLL